MNDEKPINRSSENLLWTEPVRTPTMYNHTFPSFLEHASFHLSRSNPEWAERRNCNRCARRALQGQRSTDCDTAHRKYPLNHSKPTDPGKHLFNSETTCDSVQWTNSWWALAYFLSCGRPTDWLIVLVERGTVHHTSTLWDEKKPMLIFPSGFASAESPKCTVWLFKTNICTLRLTWNERWVLLLSEILLLAVANYSLKLLINY